MSPVQPANTSGSASGSQAVSGQKSVFELPPPRETPPYVPVISDTVRVDIAKVRGELYIDQYPSRASYNIKTIPDLLRDNVQRGIQIVLGTIGRIAANGDSVAAGQKTGATVASIAVQEAEPEPAQVDLVSITRPDIKFTKII